MADEIKDFKVWHPPKEDPPYVPPEWEPLWVYTEHQNPLMRIFGFRQKQLTASGGLWVICPLLFMYRKKLNFHLSELLMLVMTFGLVLSLYSMVLEHFPSKRLFWMVLLSAAAGHTHLLAFSSALYRIALTRPHWRYRLGSRSWVILSGLLPVSFCWDVAAVLLLWRLG